MSSDEVGLGGESQGGVDDGTGFREGLVSHVYLNNRVLDLMLGNVGIIQIEVYCAYLHQKFNKSICVSIAEYHITVFMYT